MNEALLAALTRRFTAVAEVLPQVLPAVESADPATDLARAYERAINCIRHHMAVDSLTRGMLREMGIGNDPHSIRSLRGIVVRTLPVERTPH